MSQINHVVSRAYIYPICQTGWLTSRHGMKCMAEEPQYCHQIDAERSTAMIEKPISKSIYRHFVLIVVDFCLLATSTLEALYTARPC